MQPKGAFSGLLNMASAQIRPSWDLMIVLVIEMCNPTAGEQWSWNGCCSSKLHVQPLSKGWLFSHNCQLRLYHGKSSLFILSIFKPISNFTYLCHNSLTLLPCKYAFVILTFLLDLIASKGACTLFGCCAAIRQICLVILSSLHLFCSSRAHHYGSIIFLCFQDPKEGIHFWR